VDKNFCDFLIFSGGAALDRKYSFQSCAQKGWTIDETAHSGHDLALALRRVPLLSNPLLREGAGNKAISASPWRTEDLGTYLASHSAVQGIDKLLKHRNPSSRFPSSFAVFRGG
jgi:hypothetical protein